MFCNKCGKEIDDDANFCVFCGKTVAHAEENTNTAQSSEQAFDEDSFINSPQNGFEDGAGNTQAFNQAPQSIPPQQTAVMQEPAGATYHTGNQNEAFQVTQQAQPVYIAAPQQPQNNGGGNTKLVVLLTILIVVAVLLGVFVTCIILGNNGVKNPISDFLNHTMGNEQTSQQATPAPSNNDSNSNSNSNSNNNNNNSTTSTPGDYMLPDSDTRYYSSSELEKLSNHDLFIARNEICARHGRIFRNAELKSYFNSKPWYHEIYSPQDFDSRIYGTLNSYEKKNTEAMKSIEHARGSSYLNA